MVIAAMKLKTFTPWKESTWYSSNQKDLVIYMILVKSKVVGGMMKFII